MRAGNQAGDVLDSTFSSLLCAPSRRARVRSRAGTFQPTLDAHAQGSAANASATFGSMVVNGYGATLAAFASEHAKAAAEL